jgi:hypothetical protein
VPDDSDEDRFVTAGQVAAYGMFVGLPSVEDLERFFFLALSASFHKLTRQGPTPPTADIDTCGATQVSYKGFERWA